MESSYRPEGIDTRPFHPYVITVLLGMALRVRDGHAELVEVADLASAARPAGTPARRAALVE